MDGHWSDSPGVFYKIPANRVLCVGGKRVFKKLFCLQMHVYRLE